MKTREFSISTDHEGMYNITARLREVIRESGVQSGLAVVYCPHTTAGITINENADPDVQHDLLLGLREAFPDRREFRHAEGNSTAHLKCSYVGPSQTGGLARTIHRSVRVLHHAQGAHAGGQRHGRRDVRDGRRSTKGERRRHDSREHGRSLEGVEGARRGRSSRTEKERLHPASKMKAKADGGEHDDQEQSCRNRDAHRHS